MTSPVVLWDIVAYHAQQAAEKYLKGYLIGRGDPVPRVHDLTVLLTRCCKHDETRSDLSTDCERLSRLGWLARYPDAPEEPRESAIRAGVATARAVREAVRQRMGRPSAGGKTQ